MSFIHDDIKKIIDTMRFRKSKLDDTEIMKKLSVFCNIRLQIIRHMGVKCL